MVTFNPFSTPDIEKAEQLAVADLSARGINLQEIERIRIDFLEEFRKAWNGSRKDKAIVKKDFLPPALGRGLIINPKEFGRSLGYIVGCLRWKQSEVLDHVDMFGDSVVTLRPHKIYLDFLIGAGRVCLTKLQEKGIPREKMGAFHTLWKIYS